MDSRAVQFEVIATSSQMIGLYLEELVAHESKVDEDAEGGQDEGLGGEAREAAAQPPLPASVVALVEAGAAAARG